MLRIKKFFSCFLAAGLILSALPGEGVFEIKAAAAITQLISIDFGSANTLPDNMVIATSAERDADGYKLTGVEDYNYLEDGKLYVLKTDPTVGNIAITASTDIFQAENRKNIYAEVSYKDISPHSEDYTFNGKEGRFFIRYNGQDETTAPEYVCLGGTDIEKTATFFLEGFEWGGGSTYDLEICTTEYTKETKLQSNTRKFSAEPVIVTGVKFYTDGNYSPVEIAVKGKNTGNIFYEGQQAEFDVTLTNKISTNVVLDLSFTQKSYDKNNELAVTGTQVGTATRTIAAGQTDKFKLAFDVDKYGLYALEISATSSSPGTDYTKTVDFSYSTKNDSLNYDMGVHQQFNKGTDDPDMGMELMTNAGLGILRSDYEWANCEKAVSGSATYETEKKLTDAMTAELNAAAKHGVKVLPIITGNNSTYNSRYGTSLTTVNSFPTDEALVGYGEFAKWLMSTEEMQKVSDMAEIWNEPDLEKYAGTETVSGSANAQARGYAYADVLKAGYDALKELDRDITVSGMCWMFSGVNYRGTEKQDAFYDYAYERLAKTAETDGEGKLVAPMDVLGIHSYPGTTNPEKTHYGTSLKWSYPQYSPVFMINWIKTFTFGGMLYNHSNLSWDSTDSSQITGQWFNPQSQNENQYNFSELDATYHTEAGYSSYSLLSSKHSDSSNEWQQGLKNIRLYAMIKANGKDDKVWFYNFINNGAAENESEWNWGMVKANSYEVPYAAKYSYLMTSAFNKVVGTDAEVDMYINDAPVNEYTSDSERGFKHAVKFTNANGERQTYMLWSTDQEYETGSGYHKMLIPGASSTISSSDTNFGTDGVAALKELEAAQTAGNVSYYDVLGNPIAASSVWDGSGYAVTDTPFYAVVDETEKDETSISLSYADEIVDAENYMNKRYTLTFGSDDRGKTYILLAGIYDSDGILKEARIKEGTAGSGAVSDTTASFGFESDLTESKVIKYFLWGDFDTLIPLCGSVENKKE